MRTTQTLGLLVALVAIAPSALATEIAAGSEVGLTRTAYTPHNLVNEAYNGRLEGIPGFIALRNATARNDIQAEDLIQAAIARGRLTEAHLEDRGFVNSVDNGLRLLRNRN